MLLQNRERIQCVRCSSIQEPKLLFSVGHPGLSTSRTIGHAANGSDVVSLGGY